MWLLWGWTIGPMISVPVVLAMSGLALTVYSSTTVSSLESV